MSETPENLTVEAAEKSAEDAKHAIAGTKATIPLFQKMLLETRNHVDDLIEMVNNWAAQEGVQLPEEESPDNG